MTGPDLEVVTVHITQIIFGERSGDTMMIMTDPQGTLLFTLHTGVIKMFLKLRSFRPV